MMQVESCLGQSKVDVKTDDNAVINNATMCLPSHALHRDVTLWSIGIARLVSMPSTRTTRFAALS
jgi:hypothetical protein